MATGPMDRAGRRSSHRWQQRASRWWLSVHAVIWLDHHHLLRFVSNTTPAVILGRFRPSPRVRTAGAVSGRCDADPGTREAHAGRRSFATQSIFATAMLVATFTPRAGFALICFAPICCALIPYLTPACVWRTAVSARARQLSGGQETNGGLHPADSNLVRSHNTVYTREGPRQ